MKSKPAFPALSGFPSLWLCLCPPDPELTSRLAVWFLRAWQRSSWDQGAGPHQGALLFLLEPQTLAFQSPDGDRDCSEAGPIPVNEDNKTERFMSTDNIWRARDNTDVPALSGNEAFHIGESSGKLGLTSLASIFF